MEYIGDKKTLETFIRHFDRFFDGMNVRCTFEGVYKRKPDLGPYRLTANKDSVMKSIVYMYVYLETTQSAIHIREVTGQKQLHHFRLCS